MRTFNLSIERVIENVFMVLLLQWTIHVEQKVCEERE